MTLTELGNYCIDAINRQIYQPADKAVVMLVGQGKAPLPRKGFPKGTLACINPRGEHVYYYPAAKLLAKLIAIGAIPRPDYKIVSTGETGTI